MKPESKSETGNQTRHITRREFIGTSVLAGLQLSSVGLLLGSRVGWAAPAAATVHDFSPNVFIHISPDNQVTIICHRSEMGQGIRSSLPVLIADELGADTRTIKIVQDPPAFARFTMK
jgi:isoquinoline 1-oxidoreductase beta subunit